MARTVMGDLWPLYLFRLIGEQLQPGDIEQLKHILKDSLTGMSEAYLEPIRSSEMSTMEIFCENSPRFLAVNS